MCTGQQRRRGRVGSGVGLVAAVATVAALATAGGGLAGMRPSAVAERLQAIVPGDRVAGVLEAAGRGDVAATTDGLAEVVGGVVAGAGALAREVARPDPADPPACDVPADLPPLDLAPHEALDGHAIARHVGLSDADLRARLDADPRITAASTFPDLATAERAVAAAMRCVRPQLPTGWQGVVPPKVECDVRFDEVVGRTLTRTATVPEPAGAVRVVLHGHTDSPTGYRVTTAFPKGPSPWLDACRTS